jgi:hypothetical protein
MTTATILDLRRTDLRRNTLSNPYWITSGQITKDCDDLGALLFSFPITKSVSPGYNPFYILGVVFQVETLFAGGTISLTIALGTLATDAVTTAGDVTEVDADEFMLSDDITSGTVGYYAAGGTGTDSDWVTAAALSDGASPFFITPADTTVPAIYALLTSDDTITAGAGRLHLLIAEVP